MPQPVTPTGIGQAKRSVLIPTNKFLGPQKNSCCQVIQQPRDIRRKSAKIVEKTRNQEHSRDTTFQQQLTNLLKKKLTTQNHVLFCRSFGSPLFIDYPLATPQELIDFTSLFTC